MKQNYVSGLGIFLCLPAFAGARLPAVNVASAAVSARAQYGMPAANVTVAPVAKPTPVAQAKKVVARAAARPTVRANIDTGEKIAMTPDFLVPNRPSSDLWAKVDTPLRMPRADEFSVITSNDMLPEESIAPTRVAATDTNEYADISKSISDLDAQIARLMDMQRRAEESVRTARVAPRTVAKNTDYTPHVETSIYPAESVTINQQIADANVAPRPTVDTRNNADDVKISRIVVPMDEPSQSDATVRRVASNNKSIQSVREDMTKMSPSELRRAFRKTFLSENKHLSTYPIDDRFDVVSDMESSIEGFTSARDLSESPDKIRPLEIKISFRNADAALSRDNYNLLSEYASIVVANPKRAIQVAIPAIATETSDSRKLAAKRLAIVEQVLRDTGVAEQRIVPVLSERNEEGFVLRIISNEQFETLTKQKRNMFGDTFGTKTYKSMSW